MKILIGSQIKELDNNTIAHEPIESIGLMERASEAMAQTVAQRTEVEKMLVFVIGKGNNGGDGLAMARMLGNAGFNCFVMMASRPVELSEDCRFNFDRLPDNVRLIEEIPPHSDDYEIVIIDALLGSGVKGELARDYKDVVDQINSCSHYVISIDMPSGMKTEFGNNPDHIVHADLTLTIEFPKLAMLLPEAGECCGEIEIVPIGLDEKYMQVAGTSYSYVTPNLIQNFTKKRAKFSHKATYGHALLICGSKGMYGAAVLSTSAALRSGCGLVTTHVPKDGAVSVTSNAPSAMLSIDPEDYFSTVPEELDKYASIGIGCGLGKATQTTKALAELLKQSRHGIVLDADALNIIALHSSMREFIPVGSVLTPHPGELRRLVGDWSGEEEKINKASDLAIALKSVVVVKGAYSMICMPDRQVFFNPTGTPGMAKGGSGDVLTGLITGLVARGYTPEEAALLGVYVHGAAGEKAANYYGEEAMNSADIIDFVGDTFNDMN